MFIQVATAFTAASLQVETSDRPPISALEQEFQMVQEQIRMSGRVTPGVYATVRKLAALVETVIEPNILESHATDQMLVDMVVGEISVCGATYQRFADGKFKQDQLAIWASMTEFKGCGGTIVEIKEKFGQCLDDRDAILKRNITACCQAHEICANDYGNCENVKLEAGFAGCDYRTHSGEECFRAVRGLISPLEGYFRQADEKYEALRAQCELYGAATKAKFAECMYLQEAVNSQVEHANELGLQINTDGSVVAKDAIIHCVMMDECYDAAVAQYNTTVGPCEATGDYGSGGDCVKNREADRHAEWTSVQVIKCMLDHYCEGGQFKEDLLKECQESITTYKLEIDYRGIPAKVDCIDIDVPMGEAVDNCVDRPYDIYDIPCEPTPMAEAPVCVEDGECPEWCVAEPSVEPIHTTVTTTEMAMPPTTTVVTTTTTDVDIAVEPIPTTRMPSLQKMKELHGAPVVLR
eukprot:CAMPEP_0204264190 /NCGR_PEP_ID=MMETSP0468-20130131/8846_1 /ASSEMBLY_ACC=CAM_ASM_000383 /TAXON_ID=2969 /ORGANISM="Oxyrrhis marina" /LENGTH=465 /DNA_ID=CAMNT_0051239029 /DNA_START=22 /DNA_END=1419 /DNA_ORIENTATION=+